MLGRQLDRAMAKFKAENPDFYHVHCGAWVIVNLGIVHEKEPQATPSTPAPK